MIHKPGFPASKSASSTRRIVSASWSMCFRSHHLYGPELRKLRRALSPLVEAGGVACARCGELIEPGTPWDLGHTDDGMGYSGPEHAACNRATNSTTVTSREW